MMQEYQWFKLYLQYWSLSQSKGTRFKLGGWEVGRSHPSKSSSWRLITCFHAGNPILLTENRAGDRVDYFFAHSSLGLPR